MDFGPVGRVGAVRQAELIRHPADVPPPAGIEGTERTADETFREGAKRQDQSDEQEGLVGEEGENDAVEPTEPGEEKQVNLFA